MRRPFPYFILALFLMPIVAVAVFAMTESFNEKPLPQYGTLPPFSLQERSGSSVTLDDLRGKIWVAGFIFTRCTEQCPLISNRMQRIQRVLRLKANFRLVSFTVDPKHDTVQVLKAYSKRVAADPYKWLFLTGEQNDVNALVHNGFRLAAAGDDGVTADATHSFKLVLVDSMGTIRGYYDSNDDEEMKNLLRDAKSLVRKAGTF